MNSIPILRQGTNEQIGTITFTGTQAKVKYIEGSYVTNKSFFDTFNCMARVLKYNEEEEEMLYILEAEITTFYADFIKDF